jgi:DNA-binding response OmpR family regulator
MRQDGESVAADQAWQGDPLYFRVVIGNTDADIDETIAEGLGEAIEHQVPGRDLEFVCCPSMRDLESLARRQPVDLFVLVLNSLEDCDVMAALRRLPQLKAAHGKPVVALAGFSPTSLSGAALRDAALQAGADAFFWLPFTPDALTEDLGGLLPGHSDRGASSPPDLEARARASNTIEYPAEGFCLQWDASALQIRVTDHHATPLRIPWKDLAALERIARGTGSNKS